MKGKAKREEGERVKRKRGIKEMKAKTVGQNVEKRKLVRKNIGTLKGKLCLLPAYIF